MRLKDGWLEGVRIIPSPNYNSRPNNQDVSLLVVHNISLPPKQFDNDFVELFFQNKLPVDKHDYFKEICGLEVSSHFYIKRNGEVIQFVSCDNRAWHAGMSTFCGKDNCNDYSIGIELQGADDISYEENQYESLIVLTKAIQHAYPSITNERITGHEHIAPERKTDPGPSFDWSRYKDAL